MTARPWDADPPPGAGRCARRRSSRNLRIVEHANEWQLNFGGGPGAAGQARVAVEQRVGAQLAKTRLADLLLLVSEVVTNSVRHGAVDETGRVYLRLWLRGEYVGVEVRDTGRQGDPAQRQPDRRRGGGFGLFLVDQLAERWGAEHDPDLRFWFEMTSR